LENTDEPISESSMTEATKPRAFSAGEMVQCGACSRANPPTRASCLYCGAALEITHVNAFAPPSLSAQKLENSSDASFYVVSRGPVRIDETTLDELAALLSEKRTELQALLSHPIGAPVFSASSARQAQLAAEQLNEKGVVAQVISCEQLGLETAPKMISAMEVRGDEIVATVGRRAEVLAAPWPEITLVVVGRLYFETREIDQKRSRTKQVIDEREMLTDEAVLDIYARNDNDGWRIRADSFDFSCLGKNKKLTTFENFTQLTSLLRELAAAAEFDDSYVRLRRALDSVWPHEPGASAKERRRTAFGKFDSSVTSLDNQLQFTRYSRLLRYLHASKSEDHAPQA
jgi:hypothetical protein